MSDLTALGADIAPLRRLIKPAAHHGRETRLDKITTTTTAVRGSGVALGSWAARLQAQGSPWAANPYYSPYQSPYPAPPYYG